MTRLQEYEIFVAEEAEEDLNDIYAYISSSYSEDSAADICQRIEREIVSLCVLPKRHRVFLKSSENCLSAIIKSFMSLMVILL